MSKRVFLIISFLIFLSGCAKMQHMDKLLDLKSLSDNQTKQEQFLLRQENKFQLLLADVKKGRLKKGISRGSIISRYGEPISAKEIQNDARIAEQFVYRHPEQIFGSEKVFLSFDKRGKLIDWLYQPATE